MLRIALIGCPSSAGAYAVGQEQAPAALRAAGLVTRLIEAGLDVDDLGDGTITPWRPDRANPRAQNVGAVIDQVRRAADLVDRAVSDGRIALVLGGDCTIGIGVIGGIRRHLRSVGIAYFDLHADLNTPASVGDGALDWMGLGHMLALPGTEPRLAEAAGRAPLLDPRCVVLVAHDDERATPWEREQIRALDLARVPVEAVRAEPIEAARQALGVLEERCERYVVHFDVDVIDFTDAPLSENTGRNTGLSLDQAIGVLAVLVSGGKLAAVTITELNPTHASAEAGLIERFAALLATALGHASR